MQRAERPLKSCQANFRTLLLSLVSLPFCAVSLLGTPLTDLDQPVLFLKKDAPGSALSQVTFLDEFGLAVVVADAAVDFRSGKYRGKLVKLVAHDPLSRLTLLRVPLSEEERTHAVELGRSLNLQAGANFYLELEGEATPSLLVGRESEYKEKPLPLELLRIHHGSSEDAPVGHPLFDSAGRLIAINYRKASEFGNGSFAFPVEALKRIQGAEVKDGVVQRSWFGVELLASDPFAVVQAVRQESPAAKAGIQKSDILIQIGPREIESYADAINAFFYLREGEKALVKFLRGTEVLEVEVVPELVPTAPPAPPVEEAPEEELEK